MEEDKKVQPHLDKDGSLLYIEDKYRHKCARCGKNDVIQKPGSKYIPDYCKACLPKVKLLNLQKARKKKHDKGMETKQYMELETPNGDKVKLRDKDEELFYLMRLENYRKDYNLDNAADKTLLSTLLMLELEVKRISNDLAVSFSQSKELALTKISDSIRKIQQDLSINRASRIDKQKEQTISEKIKEVLGKFREYKKSNQERFVYKCPSCGSKVILNREVKNGDIAIVSGKSPQAKQ